MIQHLQIFKENLKTPQSPLEGGRAVGLNVVHWHRCLGTSDPLLRTPTLSIWVRVLALKTSLSGAPQNRVE